MKTFEEYGKKLDEFAKEVGEQAKPLVDKFKEVHVGLKEGLKTADRRGFERAMKFSAKYFYSLEHAMLERDSVAKWLDSLPYKPPID